MVRCFKASGQLVIFNIHIVPLEYHVQNCFLLLVSIPDLPATLFVVKWLYSSEVEIISLKHLSSSHIIYTFEVLVSPPWMIDGFSPTLGVGFPSSALQGDVIPPILSFLLCARYADSLLISVCWMIQNTLFFCCNYNLTWKKMHLVPCVNGELFCQQCFSWILSLEMNM